MEKKYLGFAYLPALCLAVASCSSSPSTLSTQHREPTAQSAATAPDDLPYAAGTPSSTRHVQATIPQGIPTTSRCYTLSTERVVFKVFFINSDNRSDWDAKASSVGDTCDGTRRWDDQWYYYTLPDNQTRNLMLLWRNIDRREYGYVVIKNTPSLWLVYSNSGGPWTPSNGQQIKRTWTSDGKRIDIDVLNPKNEGGWTANDIWVSFGY
ncbi:MAG TPA: hypothetical protein V6D05_00345 [Stenomitos sp.]